MEQGSLGMVGTTFRRAGQAGLAYYTLSPTPAENGVRQGSAAELQQFCGLEESVYLATCNRVELFFIAQSRQPVAQIRQRFFAYFAALRAEGMAPLPAPFRDARSLLAFADEGAVERLFVVASALDSMVPGEAQILGQVKAAQAQAEASGLCRLALAKLFAEAFAVAKRVREQTALGRGRTSMLSLALELLQQQLQKPTPAGSTLVLVGTGEMILQCAQAFASRQDVRLLFVNRTLAGAQQLAARFGGAALALADFQRDPGPFAALLTSTASPVPLFAGPFLAALVGKPLLVDLSVQRDVELAAAQQLGCALWDIDRLEARATDHSAQRRGQVAEGRALVDEALERYRRKQLERSVGEAVAAWRHAGAQVLERALRDLPAVLAAHGAAAATADVESWARQLLNAWMHGPTAALKRVAHLGGHDLVTAFLHDVPASARRRQPSPAGPPAKQEDA